MDWQHIFWPALVALLWALTELVRRVRKRLSERPPPLPLVRTEMPTPDYSVPGMVATADGSGRYAAIAGHGPYPSYREFEELRARVQEDITNIRSEMASLRNALEIASSRMAELSRHLGKLEGVVEGRETRERSSPRR